MNLSVSETMNRPSPRACKQSVETVAFFDDRAIEYDREYQARTTAGYALRVRREKVLALFDQDGGKVLDVGCGPGPMAQSIVGRGCRFWGIDPSEKMLDICRARYAGDNRMQFAHGDATQLKLESNFFDAVLCMGVIDSVPAAADAIREMLRVLKPGGTLILSFTNVLSPYSWWKKYVFYPAVSHYRTVRGAQGCRTVSPPNASRRRLYTKRAATQLLKQEGAVVDRIEGYHCNPIVSPFDEWLPGAALRLAEFLDQANWRACTWMSAGWLVKAHKSSRISDNQ